MNKASGKPSGRQRGGPRSQNFRNIDPSQVASAVKVRNFRKLVELAGSDENLALALDMSEQRIQELARGERFSPETAYHIELSLEIPRFLDKVNPQITDELRARIKIPLVQIQAQQLEELELDELELKDDADEVLVESSLSEESIAEAVLPPEPSPEKAPTASTPIVTYKPSRSRNRAKLKTPRVPVEDTTTQEQTDMTEATQVKKTATKSIATKTARGRKGRARRTDVPAALQKCRQENLRILTAQVGAKGELSRLMGMSAANVSHRLNGQKHLDEEETQRIADAVGISADWFDKPQSAETVPAKALELLTPSGSPSARKAAKSATKVPATTQVVSAETLAEQSLIGTLLPEDERPQKAVRISLPTSNDATETQSALETPAVDSIKSSGTQVEESPSAVEAQAAKSAAHVNKSPAQASPIETASQDVAATEPEASAQEALAPAVPESEALASAEPESTPKPAAPTLKVPEPLITSTPTQPESSSLPSSDLTELSDLTDLDTTAPVAAALLRILRLKISQGRIDELHAAALLTEIANK